MSNWAKSCLTSEKKDGYDKRHRLEQGRAYRIALVPSKDVGYSRTTPQVRKYGASLGYEQLLAGAILRIRETISDEMTKEMGFSYIAALHDPITDSVGLPDVLSADQHDGRQRVSAYFDRPGNCWSDDNGVFAFLVPAR